MEQQMDRPATAALEESGGDTLLGPDEITATSGNDDDRAIGQRRRRQEAKRRQCSGLGHCSRGQAHGLQSKRTGQVVRGLLMHSGAAGDGLVALAQPSSYQYKRTERPAGPLRGNGSTQSSAMRWRPWRQIYNLSRFSPECPAGRAAARGNLGPHPSPMHGTTARPPQPREGSHARHGAAVAR
jgi:hypothetical protein